MEGPVPAFLGLLAVAATCCLMQPVSAQSASYRNEGDGCYVLQDYQTTVQGFTGSGGYGSSIALTADGTCVLVGSTGSKVFGMDVATGVLLFELSSYAVWLTVKTLATGETVFFPGSIYGSSGRIYQSVYTFDSAGARYRWGTSLSARTSGGGQIWSYGSSLTVQAGTEDALVTLSKISTANYGPSNDAVVNLMSNGAELWTGAIMNSSFNQYGSTLSSNGELAFIGVEKSYSTLPTGPETTQLVAFNASGHPEVLRIVPDEWTDKQVAGHGCVDPFILQEGENFVALDLRSGGEIVLWSGWTPEAAASFPQFSFKALPLDDDPHVVVHAKVTTLASLVTLTQFNLTAGPEATASLALDCSSFTSSLSSSLLFKPLPGRRNVASLSLGRDSLYFIIDLARLVELANGTLDVPDDNSGYYALTAQDGSRVRLSGSTIVGRAGPDAARVNCTRHSCEWRPSEDVPCVCPTSTATTSATTTETTTGTDTSTRTTGTSTNTTTTTASTSTETHTSTSRTGTTTVTTTTTGTSSSTTTSTATATTSTATTVTTSTVTSTTTFTPLSSLPPAESAAAASSKPSPRTRASSSAVVALTLSVTWLQR